MVSEIGMEETGKSPFLVVGGNRIFIPREERKMLMGLLHSTHLSERSMWTNAKRLWFWPELKNACKQGAEGCVKCQVESEAKPREDLVILDDLSRMYCIELVGIDLFSLGGHSYLSMVEKRSGFKFCSMLGMTTSDEVQKQLKNWFLC